MIDGLKKFCSRAKACAARIAAPAAIGTAVALANAPAVASAQFTPDTMDAIVFPVTLESIVTATVTAGAAVLVLVFAWKGGFRMVWKLLTRLLGAV